MSLETLSLFSTLADAVGDALRAVDDWGLSGDRAGQYRADLVADEIVLNGLADAGLAVLSEESGITGDGVSSPIVIVDPLDGSTNASRGLPWFATSLCLVDEQGPIAALVRNQANGDTFTAERDRPALRNGRPIRPSGCEVLSEAFIGVNGLPARHHGWQQFRAYGASALDVCMVACGVLDGYVDFDTEAHGVWDYAGAMFICERAGAVVVDAFGRDLIVRDHTARRTPVAAGTQELLDVLLAARSSVQN